MQSEARLFPTQAAAALTLLSMMLIGKCHAGDKVANHAAYHDCFLADGIHVVHVILVDWRASQQTPHRAQDSIPSCSVQQGVGPDSSAAVPTGVCRTRAAAEGAAGNSHDQADDQYTGKHKLAGRL